ncbi:MAG: hypothetical protein GXO99_01075 [Nitrospirae bacterium]|nr:hypothetical protein [Nitrospirota bacterium]
MKKLLTTLTFVTLIAMTLSAFASGYGRTGGSGSGAIGRGHGMMGMMMNGSGMMNSYGMGPGMMGWTNKNTYQQRNYKHWTEPKRDTEKAFSPFKGYNENYRAPYSR